MGMIVWHWLRRTLREQVGEVRAGFADPLSCLYQFPAALKSELISVLDFRGSIGAVGVAYKVALVVVDHDTIVEGVDAQKTILPALCFAAQV